jgi:hypothetical protein
MPACITLKCFVIIMTLPLHDLLTVQTQKVSVVAILEIEYPCLEELLLKETFHFTLQSAALGI